MPGAWPKEQVEMLEKLSKKYHISIIAEKMGKSENAIYLKAKRLGITLIVDGRRWTDEEEKILRELWGYQSIETIAKKLKRTPHALKLKAVKLGLGPMIKNNYEVLTINDISELLNVTRDRIVMTWVDLGLNLKKKRLTKTRTYYVVTIEDLITFLEEHQNEWDSRNLEVNILGVEPQWLREKRMRDLDENPLWYRKWTEEEIKKVEDLFKMGRTYEEIAAKVERSEWSVANLLRNRGYSYQLPIYWTEEEIKFLEENYLNMTYAEIAKQIGRTEGAVRFKLSSLGHQKRKELIMNKLLTLEETKRLLIAYRETLDREVLSILVECNLKLVKYIANRYLNKGLTFEELESAGNEGLIKAIMTFDPEKYGMVTFSTYIAAAIENEIKLELRKYIKHSHVLSFNQAIGQNENKEETIIEDIVGTDENIIVDQVINIAMAEMVREELENLTPKQRELLLLRYEKEKTQKEVAEIFGVSPTAISQQEKRALRKMKNPVTMQKLRDFREN